MNKSPFTFYTIGEDKTVTGRTTILKEAFQYLESFDSDLILRITCGYGDFRSRLDLSFTTKKELSEAYETLINFLAGDAAGAQSEVSSYNEMYI